MCLACMDGNLQRVYTNQELNMQIDYYNFMFNLGNYDTEGEATKIFYVLERNLNNSDLFLDYSNEEYQPRDFSGIQFDVRDC